MPPAQLRDGAHYPSWSDIDLAAWQEKWPNFHPKEIACRGSGSLLLNMDALTKLQDLRTALGRPLIVTSAYRSPAYNAKVGGAKNSMHLQGRAFDISLQNHDPVELETAAKDHGFTGIGRYPKQRFIHIDTGPARWWGAPEWPASLSGGFPAEQKPAAPAAKRAAKSGAILTGAGTATAVLSQVDVEDVAQKLTAFQGALPVLEWLAANWWLPVGLLILGGTATLLVPRLLNRESDEKAKGFVPVEKARAD